MSEHPRQDKKAKTSISIRRRVLDGAREVARLTDRSTSWVIEKFVQRGLEERRRGDGAQGGATET